MDNTAPLVRHVAPTTPTPTSASSSDASQWRLTQSNEFGRSLSVAQFDTDERFLIGTQVAALLKRETFNMYRSMKIKHVNIQRANPEQVEYLARIGAVKPGTHSVTLIPYETGLYFIADAWYRQHRFELPYCTRKPRNRVRSFLAEKPRLHRRKPHPWNVHRALKMDDLTETSAPAPAPAATPEAVLPPAPAHGAVTSTPAPALASKEVARAPLFSLPDCPDDLPQRNTAVGAPSPAVGASSVADCQNGAAIHDASRYFRSIMECS